MKDLLLKKYSTVYKINLYYINILIFFFSMKSYYCLEEDCYHLEEIDVIDLCEDIEEEEEEREEGPIKSIMAKASSLLISLNKNRKKRFAPMKRFARERTKDHVKTADKLGEVVQEGRAVYEDDLTAETVINADREPQTKGAFEPPVRGFPPRHWIAPSTSQPPTQWTEPSTSQPTHWAEPSTS